MAGKKGSTTKYQYRSTSAGEKSNAPWDGVVDLCRCGCIHCVHLVWLASCKTFKSCCPSKYSGFKIWVLCFWVLGTPFSRFGCFVLLSSFLSALFLKLPFPNDINYLGSCTSSASGKRLVTPRYFYRFPILPSKQPVFPKLTNSHAWLQSPDILLGADIDRFNLICTFPTETHFIPNKPGPCTSAQGTLEYLGYGVTVLVSSFVFLKNNISLFPPLVYPHSMW